MSCVVGNYRKKKIEQREKLVLIEKKIIQVIEIDAKFGYPLITSLKVIEIQFVRKCTITILSSAPDPCQDRGQDHSCSQ